MKNRRFIAYLFDMSFICIILFILGIAFHTKNIDVLDTEFGHLNQSFFDHKISFITYLHHYASIAYDLDRQKVVIHFIGILIMLGYFVILPYYNKGRTIGKMFMKIKVVKEGDITINDFLLRSFITSGIGYLLLSLLFLFIFPAFSYFLMVSILGFFQIVLVVVSGFMISYKKKGIEDLITNTNVIMDC